METVLYLGAVCPVAGAFLLGAWLLGLFPESRE